MRAVEAPGVSSPARLRTMTWELLCLRYDPFAGDKDTEPYRLLLDAIVTALTRCECIDCLQPIKPGERTRIMTARFAEGLRTIRWCQWCCRAQVKADRDGLVAVVARLELGRARRAARELHSRLPRATRSPIERMVDAACGLWQ